MIDAALGFVRVHALFYTFPGVKLDNGINEDGRKLGENEILLAG